jgi:hypothetical protein
MRERSGTNQRHTEFAVMEAALSLARSARSSARKLCDALQKPVGINGLGKVSVISGFERPMVILLSRKCGQCQCRHTRISMLLFQRTDLLQQRVSILSGQTDIADDDIWPLQHVRRSKPFGRSPHAKRCNSSTRQVPRSGSFARIRIG